MKVKTRKRATLPKAPKFVQIAATTKGDITRGLTAALYALDARGRVWKYVVEYVDGLSLNARGWVRLPTVSLGDVSSLDDDEEENREHR